MPKQSIQLSVADNLCQMARNFKSGDPAQASAIRKEFSLQSKNNLERAVVYLMEVIGARDAQWQDLQKEHKALKELLDLKAPGWDTEDETPAAKPESAAVNLTEGENGAAQTL